MGEINIYQRLREAQLELKAPKNETGRFGKSRSAEAILEAAKPVLSEHGLTLNITDKIIQVGGRHYVDSTATVYDDAGAHVSACAQAWEGEVDRGLDSSQVTGKTSSYARKYALGGLLAIDDTKDADRDKEYQPEKPVMVAAAKPAVGSAPTNADLISAPQMRKMQAMFGELGITDREDRHKYTNRVVGRAIESSRDLTRGEAVRVIDSLDENLFELARSQDVGGQS